MFLLDDHIFEEGDKEDWFYSDNANQNFDIGVGAKQGK
jgi:hypothetical protein